MKVLLADDHWVSRAAIRQLLGDTGQGTEFVEAESFDEALIKAEKHGDLGLIVCDLIMPGLTVLEDLNRLLSSTSAPVAIFSMIEDRHDVLRVMDLGAAGFVPKTLPGKQIREALLQIAAGETYLPQVELKAMPRQAFEAEGYRSFDSIPRRALNSLTGRQRDVLSCLARGATNEVIARDLGLSQNTVRIHISAILRTLELKNRTQAALIAARYLAEESATRR